MKVWVLTWDRSDNAQCDEYFDRVWAHEPTLEEIGVATCSDDKIAKHILKGGGRIDKENSWYYLRSMDIT